MRLWALVILFIALSASAQTLSEKIQSLQDFKTNQDNFNKDEHGRADAARVQLENRIDKQLEILGAAQQAQNADIETLQGSATEAKFLGAVAIFLIPLCVAWIFRGMNKRERDAAEELAARDKIREKILDRATALEQSLATIKMSLSLLTNVVDRLSTVLIEGVHHPDDTHLTADQLLDKLPSSIAPSLAELSHDDHSQLSGLMRERAVDPEVPKKEQNMAKQLMPVLDMVRQLRELEKQAAEPKGEA